MEYTGREEHGAGQGYRRHADEQKKRCSIVHSSLIITGGTDSIKSVSFSYQVVTLKDIYLADVYIQSELQ